MVNTEPQPNRGAAVGCDGPSLWESKQAPRVENIPLQSLLRQVCPQRWNTVSSAGVCLRQIVPKQSSRARTSPGLRMVPSKNEWHLFQMLLLLR